MGENALCYQRSVEYPGLVKPYRRESGSIDQSVIESSTRSSDGFGLTNKYSRMNELHTKQKQNYDPFSRYDDDLGEEHYFLVPKVQGNSLQVSEWRRTVKSSRSLKNIAKLASDIKQVETSVGKNRNQTYPPLYKRPQTQLSDLDKKRFEGEYCYISADQSSKDKHSFCRSTVGISFNRKNDSEQLREFASKFATLGDEIPKPQSSSHSLGERKFDTWVELDGISESPTKTRVIRTQPEKIIDYCTCMICVKGIFYHCTDDEDETVDNVCSCTGTKGSVLKRWTCLSILACLMPCIFCYLPAKGCLNLCRKCKNNNDKRMRDSNLNVRYRKTEQRRSRETTTLL